MAELEERIVTFLVEETLYKRERIQLATTLADDIGMDGDDAVAFFEKFGEKFHVDLTLLFDHWHQHFVPEGCGPRAGCIGVFVAGVFVGFLLTWTSSRIPVWVSVPVVTIAFCWAYLKIQQRNAGPEDEHLTVTVQDLVDAAIAGRWVKEYPPPAALRAPEP